MARVQAVLAPVAPARGDAYLDPACAACAGRAVPAEGALAPQAFFVGEAPGPTEELARRPFVGRAGNLLRGALAEAGWSPDEVWITNVVKAFPYELEGEKRRIRRPTTDEVRACLAHLVKEVDALRPRLLVALGRTAAEGLLGRRVSALGPLRASVHAARPELGGAPVFVTIHPSALHYGAQRGQRDAFVADLAAARARLEAERP
jgi:uracil-DNA glycosylase